MYHLYTAEVIYVALPEATAYLKFDDLYTLTVSHKLMYKLEYEKLDGNNMNEFYDFIESHYIIINNFNSYSLIFSRFMCKIKDSKL